MLTKKLYRIILCLFSLLCVSVQVHAIEIVIDKGVENPIPVAIVPFGWSQASSVAPLDVAGIIDNDLTRSARFATMEEKDLPQRPVSFDEVNFKDWRLVGMENLVIGQLTQDSNGGYEVEFRLLDVYKGKQIACGRACIRAR